MPSTTPSQPKIAIIGAGPVGLTLANILQRNGITSFTVFERDTTAQSTSNALAQGSGTLDIHADSGQRALAAAGLLEAFHRVARPEGEAVRVARKDGVVVWDENNHSQGNGHAAAKEPGGKPEAESRGRPEIDRAALRALLLSALPPERIIWGKHVSSLSPVPGTTSAAAKWTINFSRDGDAPPQLQPQYDLVLGADGAWSRVRAQLTDARPYFTGVVALDAWLDDVEGRRPDVARFIGRGSRFTFSADRALIFQRHGDGSARCYACVRFRDDADAANTTTNADAAVVEARIAASLGLEEAAEIGRGGIDWDVPGVRRRFLETYFGDYAAEAREAALSLTQRPVLRPLYMLPVGLTWPSRPGVTVLGDAAHLMTPFAGVGVNVGMVDALELAEGIVGYVKKGAGQGAASLAEVISDYEKGMWARSSRDAAKTAHALEVQFQEGGCEKMVELMSCGDADSE
ncbi:hypothetical protein DL765_002281 [Monosporascus sp. GIB2]|nr:hypothetical protein DL765_002281 [Monosporascus sp. GIB2]